MSSSVFNSKHHKSSRNLKKLLISSPLLLSPLNSPTTPQVSSFRPSSVPVVVLRSKYNFCAQNATEVSIRANDYFKLLDRPGNGWLMVQCIDRNETGLIPALYVEIAVNDAKTPVSVEWLTQVKTPRSAILDEIKSIKVSSVLLDAGSHAWYRLDIRMCSGSVKYVAKYYQDFYLLHVCLLEEFYKSVKLPSLPKPLRTPGKAVPATWVNPSDKSHMKDLVTQCEELDKYMNLLLKVQDLLQCDTLLDFVNGHTNKCYEVPKKKNQPSEDTINNNLYPHSQNIISILNPQRKLSFSPTAPLPPVQMPATSLPKSTSTMKLINYSNTKYLSYLNQSVSQPTSPTLPLESTMTSPTKTPTGKCNITESKSCQTLSSFTSLFASYDISTEEDASLSPSRAGPGAATSPQRRHDVFFRSTESSNTEGSFDLVMSTTHHFSNSTDSMLSNGSYVKGAGSEPRTPTMNLNCFGPVDGITDNEYGEEPDYFRPLEPKMHKEMVAWTTKHYEYPVGDNKHSDGTHNRWEILPKNPARQANNI